MDKNVKDKRIRKYFIYSVLCSLFVCLLVFLWLSHTMSDRTEGSVIEVGDVYMSEVNVQLRQKFDAITDLRLEQVAGIVGRVQPAKFQYGKELIDELRLCAEVRNFSYLGLYSREGEVLNIMGENLAVQDYDDELLPSLDSTGRGIALATNESGQKFLMLAVSVEYPLEDGAKSTALVAGISMEYLNEALCLDVEDSVIYTHVINSDGSFVIRSSDAYRENYFSRVEALVEEYKGKTAQDYIEEIKKAIAANEEYSTIVVVDGEERHLYCSPVSENVDWYLISVMQGNVLADTLGRLEDRRMTLTFGSYAAIIITLLIIFVIYYRFTKKQVRELGQAERLAARANAAKSEFLSSMSHDIRTPMNAIIGMTEIALRDIEDPERTKDCLQKIRLSSKHLLGLINDVLDMSKIESGKMTLNVAPMSLREIMDDVVNIVRPQVKSRAQYFDIYIEDILAEDVYCDMVRLNQVLLNLLSNALKFTPEGGRIDVHIYQEPSPEGEEYIRTHFIVEDTGIGMSEEFQKKIFNTFEREDREQVHGIVGTGLGTSITKSIITLMGGTIDLQSEEGKGSRFHVTLDLKKAEIKESEMWLPDWNVLVVDDDERLCSSAVANLKELGVCAEFTLDSTKAVEMIEARRKKKDDYRFVLIDWRMPTMDGLQTVKQIREKVGEDIPIFLISAYDWGDIEDQVVASEIEGFIAKPLFKSTLYTALRKYVEGHEEEEEKKEEEYNFNGKRVLLAEDIDINWEIANEILSAAGLKLDRAIHGKECVEMFEKSETGFYDVILMDVRMPVMDGYEATEAIRALDRPDNDLPIIAMTADAFSDDAQRCFESGMNAHLAKPLDIKECMRTLQKFLE